MINPSLRNGPVFRGLRIGLLGGSFNPAHEGHRAISLAALRQLGLDQVWWLVAPQNPLKKAKDMMPLAQRLGMARAMAGSHPRLRVTGIEADLHSAYTIETLTKLRARMPGVHFVWLMGADNLLSFSKWKRWQDLFALVPIAVFHRPGYAAGRMRGQAAIRFAAHFVAAQGMKDLAIKPAPAYGFLAHRKNSLSATRLRQRHDT